MTRNLLVWVVMPWRRDNGATYPAGRLLLIPVEEYRKWAGLDYLARDFRRCRHWSGVEYLHAVNPCGDLLWPTSPQRPSQPLTPVLPMEFKPAPEVQKRVPRPDPMPLPAPGVIRRGCGGCVKRALATEKTHAAS